MIIPVSPYDDLMKRVCADTPPVPFAVLKAMVWIESEFNPNSHSVSDARGLCQLIPRWHADGVGKRVASEMGVPLTDTLWYDPEFSLRAGAQYLRWCYTSDGSRSWERAVRKYHSGSADTAGDFADGQGTTSDQHVQRFREALATLQGGSGMGNTYGNVPQFGYVDRYIISKREGFGWDNLGARNIKGITFHRMVGTLRGTDGYFRDPAISSYTDYGIATSTSDPGMQGIIWLWNYPWGVRAPWASGPVSSPYGDGLALVQKYGINAVNRDTLSLEIGGTNEVIDDFTWGEIIHFTAYWADQYKIPWETFPLNPFTGISFLFFHEEFTYGTGKRCPFQYFKDNIDRVVRDVQAMLKRYQTTIVTAPDPVVSIPPTPTTALKVGDWVQFDGVYNIRRAWSTSDIFEGQANITAQTDAGTKAKIIAGPNVNDGYTWWDVEIPGLGTGHVIADGMSKTTAPLPAPEPVKMWKSPAPVKELALANPDTFGDLVLQNGTHFKPVFDTVEAVHKGKQRRFALDGDDVDVIGPDYKPGDRFEALCRFTNASGTEYLYLSNHARVYFNDFKRVKD